MNNNTFIQQQVFDIDIDIDTDVLYRIGALGLVFLSSVIGVAPASMGCIATTSISGEYTDELYILRSFTAGIMLSLSTVHVIADSFEDLDGLAGKFPLASLFVIAGVYLMNAAENLIFLGFRHQAGSEFEPVPNVQADGVSPCFDPSTLDKAFTTRTADDKCSQEDSILPLLGRVEQNQFRSSAAGGCNEDDAFSLPVGVECGTLCRGTNLAGEEGRRVALAHLMEAGIVVHSVIIGMDLGALNGRAGSVAALTLANCLHQLFEGVGLGACIASAGPRLSRRRRLAMAAVFSLTFPAGGAAGILLTQADLFHAGGLTRRWLNGALNGLSGGLLLYMSLVTLLAEDMARPDLRRAGRTWLRFKMQAAMVVGSGLMAVLALWA